MKITKQTIQAAEDTERYEDEIKEIGQEFTSENTSINVTKVPAVFKLVKGWQPGTVNLDYGGGRADTAAEYLAPLDVINLVYDPFNRTADHNKEVIRLIREHGGADTATCSNVLNVIKEPEVRLNVLENIKKLIKPDGEVYITVYEGSGKGDEGPTKAGYQLNRRTADYLDEIRQVFPDAKRKGKLIIAHPGQVVQSATDIKSERRYYGGAYDIDPYQYFGTEELLSFGDSVAERLSKCCGCFVELSDIYIVDYSRVVMEFTIDNDFNVDAQFDIDMRRIRRPKDIDKYADEVISEVLEEYNAYTGDDIDTCPVTSAQTIQADWYDPPDYEDPYEKETTEYIDISMDTYITVDETGWDYEDFSWSRGDLSDGWWSMDVDGGYTYIKSDETVSWDASKLIKDYIPDLPGRYHITADLVLVYTITYEAWIDSYGPDDYDVDVIEDSVECEFEPEKSKIRSINIE